jgi:hypothetical protein
MNQKGLKFGSSNVSVIDMDKLFGVAVVLFISFLTVFGVFEIGIYQYQYYIEKGLRKLIVVRIYGVSNWNCTYICFRSASQTV